MKKIIALILSFLILAGCTANTTNNAPAEEQSHQNSVYVKSVWLTYYELQELIKPTESEFKEKITYCFNDLKQMGFNTVTVQVRPCADAFYKSTYFVSSEYAFGKQGEEMPYDPLEVMCSVAESVGIRIEAWINPYRVSQSSDIDKLSKNNIAYKWYKDKKTKSRVYVTKKNIYFNPANDEVTKLIINGVKEIVENYKIDAIHFDDYFYPTTDEDIDKIEYKQYKKNAGDLSLDDFRREKVNAMIKSVYKAIKSINENVLFGISPASNIKNDYSNLYADVEKWASEKGYVDYICPQIYFGFKNVYQPFMLTTKKWVHISNCNLYIGLPLYKANKKDKYSAENDKAIINEFVDNSNIIARQITFISKIDEIDGFYVFSYSSLSDENCKAEVENMLEAMQNSNPR